MKQTLTRYLPVKMMVVLLAVLLLSPTPMKAQQALGTPGLIHVPTAEMDSAGVARIGVHYVNKHMIPDEMVCDGEKFNSLTNYLSITPFSWVELSYGYTLWKMHRNLRKANPTGFYSKDRYFSLRIQPLKENAWWPSVVIGGNDVWGSGESGESGSNFYRNYYLALSKHLDLGGNLIGGHLAYRHWKLDSNSRWNGVVGGLTFQPAFYPKLRLMGEYDGWGVNAGADCEVFRYVLLQLSFQQCKYLSAGLCLRIGLL